MDLLRTEQLMRKDKSCNSLTDLQNGMPGQNPVPGTQVTHDQNPGVEVLT